MPIVAAYGTLGVVGALYVWRHGDPFLASEVWAMIGSACLACRLSLLMPTYGVTVKPDGITVGGFLRHRDIRWLDVAAVGVARRYGERVVTITLVTGEWVSLPTPRSLLDRGFDEKAGAIRQSYNSAVGSG
jgi:hypothetical protein